MERPPSNDPLHGLTLETIVKALVDHYGWDELGRIIDIRAFNFQPSVSSTLKFLRKTPWARSKVERLYLGMRWEQGAREESLRKEKEVRATSRHDPSSVTPPEPHEPFA